jgi:hypothetical protein
LNEKQFDIGEDPELAELHMKASRHFEQAAAYREEGTNRQQDYELAASVRALKAFDEILEKDKGSMEPFYQENEH